MGTDISKMLSVDNSNQNQINQISNNSKNLLFFEYAKKLCQKVMLPQCQSIANQFFKHGWILQAIYLYKKIICSDPNYKCEIEGLGNYELTAHYYEWKIYKWYQQKKKAKEIKQSPYDALSLCYTLLKGHEQYQTEIRLGIAWYEKMNKKYQGSFQFLMGLGNLYSIIGSYDEALNCYDKVISVKPTFKNAYICRAMIYIYRRINYDKARENAQLALKLSQQNKNEYADFILCMCTERIDEKIAKLKQIHNKYPYYPRILYQIGVCYGGSKKNYDQAIVWFKKCTKIASLYSSAYFQIAVNYQLKLNKNKSKKWYYQAIKTKKTYAQAYDNLLDIYVQGRKTDEQILIYLYNQKLVDLQYFCTEIGKSFVRRGTQQQIKRSIRWFERGIQKYPYNYQIQDNLGKSYFKLQQTQKAKSCYYKSIQLNHEYYSSYYNLGVCYQHQGYQDKSEIMYKKSIQICPRFRQGWNKLGNICISKKKYHQALYHYTNAIKFDTNDTLALINLGFCFIKIDQYHKGFQHFSNALQALPYDRNDFNSRDKTFLLKQLTQLKEEGEQISNIQQMSKEQKQSIDNIMKYIQTKFNVNSIRNRKYQTGINDKDINTDMQTINQNKVILKLKNIGTILYQIETLFIIQDEYPLIVSLFKSSILRTKKVSNSKIQSNFKQIIIKTKQNIKEYQNYIQQLPRKNEEIKLAECVPTNQSIDLLESFDNFNDHSQLYTHIDRVNKAAQEYFIDFRLLVEEIRRKSNGILNGIYTKIPYNQLDKFKVYLSIFQKMFNKQLTKQYIKNIAKKIYANLQKYPQITKSIITQHTMTIWNQQITNILRNRKQTQTPTKFQATDLICAKCEYRSVQDIIKAIQIIQYYCIQMQYQIISLDNRLNIPLVEDVVIYIRIKDALCSLHLALYRNKILFEEEHYQEEQDQIPSSILEFIFGGCFYMWGHDLQNRFMAGCKYIEEHICEWQLEQKIKYQQQDEGIQQSLDRILPH